jgi:hypothetical protein
MLVHENAVGLSAATIFVLLLAASSVLANSFGRLLIESLEL